jgi:hypothetical protein
MCMASDKHRNRIPVKGADYTKAGMNTNYHINPLYKNPLY